jgi:c-di-GMP-binding flagellar brake protein YcgR
MRNKERIGSHNLVAYECLDEDNHEIKQGIGRTLNISEGGILLETHSPLEPGYLVSLTIGMEEDLMDIKGKVAHSGEGDEGKFENGIEFSAMNAEEMQFLQQFITIFKGELEQS